MFPMTALRILQFVVTTCAMFVAGCSLSSSPPNILLVVLDTVRSDLIGTSTGHGSLTPNIDEISRRGTTFANTVAPAPWTVPSHGSLFTGLYRFRHGAGHEHFGLDASLSTLAEVLQSRGYSTVGINCNPWLHRQSGFAQGFDAYEDIYRNVVGEDDKGGGLATAKAAQWLAQLCKSEKPFFMFINYMEAHLPYSPPKHILDRMKSSGLAFTFDSFSVARAESVIAGTCELDREEMLTVRNLYLAEIAYLDDLLGEPLALLRRSACMNRTLVIVTSDHGEHLGGHDLMGHEFSVFDPVLRIPLILRCPGAFAEGKKVKAPVSLVDIYPTVLAIAGIEEGSSGCQGKNLLTFPGSARDTDRVILSEYGRPTTLIQKYWRSRYPETDMSAYERSLRALRRGRYKYIATDRGEEFLYDLLEDQSEMHDIADSLPDVVRDLRDAAAELE